MFPCAKISSPAASAAAAAVAGVVRSVRRGEGDRSAGAPRVSVMRYTSLQLANATPEQG